MLDLTTYTPEHRQELEDLLNTPAWRKVIENGLVDRVAKKRIEPGSTRDYIGAAIDQLLSFNEHRVRRRKDILRPSTLSTPITRGKFSDRIRI